MPSIITEPKIENLRRLQPGKHRVGRREEEIARSCHVTTQLRPNGEGGYLRTVKRSNTFSCTTHHNYVIKSSNSYETSKVEDQSKSEGLTIEVNCPPQYQRVEHHGRGYDYTTNNRLIDSPKPKLQETRDRSFLRIGQHQNQHRTDSKAVTRVSIANNNPQDNNTRPFKMQKIIPTSLVIAEETKYGNKTQLVDNIQAKETSCEQFMTTEGNRRLRRKIFSSHKYHKTVTKTNKEPSEDGDLNMGSTEVIKSVTTSDENHQNGFQTSYIHHFNGSKDKIKIERQEIGKMGNNRTLPGKIEIFKDWCKYPRNRTKILTTNELKAIGTQNISISYNSTIQPNNKRELIEDLNPISIPIDIVRSQDAIFTPLEKSSSFTESNVVSSSNSLLESRLTNNNDTLPSRHEIRNYRKDNSSLSSYTTSPTVRAIPNTHSKFPKKNYQETERKLSVESYRETTDIARPHDAIFTPLEKSSSFTESNIVSSSNSLLDIRLTNNNDTLPSRHEIRNHRKDNSSLSSYTTSPTVRTIPNTHLKFPKKNYQETERNLSVESYYKNTDIVRPHDAIFTPLEKSSSFVESNIISSSNSLLESRLTNNDDTLPSKHEIRNHRKDNSSPSSYTISPTVRAIPKMHPKFPKKSCQETDHKLSVESYSNVSSEIYTTKSESFNPAMKQMTHSPVIDCKVRNFSRSLKSVPTVTFRKINQDSGRWQSMGNWSQQESSSEDSTSQLKQDKFNISQIRNFTGRRELSSSSSNSNTLKQQKVSPALYSSSINSSREESLTDEDRSMNELLLDESKLKKPISQYYFGVPTARTKYKKDIDNVIVSSSSFDLSSVEKLPSPKLISREERGDYQKSWSGSEHQTMQWSSTKENNNENSFFKETRSRRGPIEVCFSVKSHCQTRTIDEDPYTKELKKGEPEMVKNILERKDEPSNKHEQKIFQEKYSDGTHLWGRSLSARENENEITFSREIKTSKEPMELRFSVTSFEHQRLLRENTENEQTGQSAEKLSTIKKLKTEKKLLDERKDPIKENWSEEEQEITETERKRKKISKEIRKECPVEVRFSVQSLSKDKSEQNNYKQNTKLEKPTAIQVDLECFGRIRKEEKFEEMLIRKLSNLRETTNTNNKLSRTLSDLLIVSKQEQDEKISPVMTKQSPMISQPMNGERKMNSAITSEFVLKKPIIQRDNRAIDKLSLQATTIDIKERDKFVYKISTPNPISNNYFNQVETQISNNSANAKESTTKFTVKKSMNELSHITNGRKNIPEISSNILESTINECVSASKYPPTKFFQKTNISKELSPYITREENSLKNNANEICKKFSALSKSRDILEEDTMTNRFKKNENFAIKFPVQMEERNVLPKISEYPVKIPEIITPLKSPSYMNQLLYNTLNTESNLELQPKETEKSVSTMILSESKATSQIEKEIKNTSLRNKSNRLEKELQEIEWIVKNQIESADSKTDIFPSTSDFDVEETNVLKSNISSDTSGRSFISHSHLDVEKKTQRHLLSPLDTNSVFLQQDKKESEETIHRCEFTLKPDAAIINKPIPTINRETIICYLQSQPSHRGFKLKNWKEEVVINRMFLDVENIAKPANDGKLDCSTSNQIIAPTDLAQCIDYNNFQLISDNKSYTCKETTPVSQRNFFRSTSIETGNREIAQCTRDLPINSLKTTIKKELNTRMASNTSGLFHRPNNPKQYEKSNNYESHLRRHSMEKELKQDGIKSNMNCIYETSV